jgi:thymidylate synthase
LLWMIRGCTDSKQLAQRNVHIWDANGSREFLDRGGFQHREVGDLGPIYGFQWRHFGAKYVDCHTDYRGQGVDQLAAVIQIIKTNPTDRRLVVSAWNPVCLAEMALPPCHVIYQFYVADGRLSCQMYQRSVDGGIGCPYNIASYSLLTIMVAKVCNLLPGEFVYCLGDAHVYLNHVEALKQQCERTPRPFPVLRVKRDVSSIDDFRYEDFELEGYKPHDTIKMAMAV